MHKVAYVLPDGMMGGLQSWTIGHEGYCRKCPASEVIDSKPSIISREQSKKKHSDTPQTATNLHDGANILAFHDLQCASARHGGKLHMRAG